MNATREVAVTLSPELLDHLREEAQALGVAIEYLIASLIVDTMEKARDAAQPTLARVA